ncbi:diguanylate cyclase [Clostridium beijerinckii]|uniref:diguanylate cyclase n=1 Tax=Clostridium beijerinckii TaxID=1520 RepID=UPI00098C411E|nr:diguanylate cyclase [Clostridium beijerinckii]MBA8933303.1 diguanylate cyclase (GGDEF)-like protein [Clostridium beijerinckii]NRT36751.1 diguanylate cyclase (GGDEF)-like protein [Clostridium beijerinckii]NRT43816.1 diguanylate cyclase (GGDEF)-like protein [Clostridium beijerinckii]NRU37504.1 diguanylate cyclase (GGDEF)-like protein [Clostridium beijerinckii]NRZ22190.1 diguanylate cyclase (GGDEF)-like protein [Clostridium beijerinckii]
MEKNSVRYTRVIRTIRKRYILALCIIIFALLLSQIIVQCNINNEMSYSRIINIAGRQRMLSQKISKDVYAIYLSENKETEDLYIDELASALEIWEKSSTDLQRGNIEEGISKISNKKIEDMFLDIKKPHEAMINSSHEIIDMAKISNYNRSQFLSKMRIIEENEKLFLKGMDDIVFQYDLDAKEKILMIKNIEIILLAITLMLILFEILFIFAPAEKSIIKAFRDINESRKNFYKLFEVAPGAMFLVDYDTEDVILINKQGKDFKSKLFEKDKKLNIRNIIFSKVENNDEWIKKIKFNERLENQEMVITTEAEKNIAMLISSIKLYFGKKSTILLAIADITNQKKEKEDLEKLANVDELTGIFNRRYGLSILEDTYAKAKSDDEDFSICFIDIDGLKLVNDKFGHDEGDWYIKTIANCIKENIGESNSAFRHGGDEFIVIFPKIDSGQVNKIIDKIQKRLKIIEDSEGKTYKLEISFGLTSYKLNESDNLEELLRKADYKMYENKKLKKASR